jgi:hypothetical protein
VRPRRPGGVAGVEALGQAEIDDLGRAVGGDEDIAGFQVAVKHRVLVGVVDCLANGAEQPHALRRGQAAGVAVAVDRLAVDVLHHEVGQAVGRGAAVEQPGDVRVVEARQHLPLGAEALQPLVAAQVAADHLEGDLLLVVVHAGREVDGAHAAAPEQPPDLIGADARADGRPPGGRAGRGRRKQRLEVHGRRREGVSGQHPLDLGAEVGVVAAGPAQEGVALRRGESGGRLEQLADSGIALGRHVSRPPATGSGGRRWPAGSRARPG